MWKDDLGGPSHLAQKGQKNRGDPGPFQCRDDVLWERGEKENNPQKEGLPQHGKETIESTANGQ